MTVWKRYTHLPDGQLHGFTNAIAKVSFCGREDGLGLTWTVVEKCDAILETDMEELYDSFKCRNCVRVSEDTYPPAFVASRFPRPSITPGQEPADSPSQP